MDRLSIITGIITIIILDIYITLIGYEAYKPGGPDTLYILYIIVFFAAGLLVIWDTKKHILGEYVAMRDVKNGWNNEIEDDEWPEWDESDDEYFTEEE
jgi:hypothetical protein